MPVPNRVVGLSADPSFKSILSVSNRKDLSPKLGTELGNLQLKDLSDQQIEDLAAFVAHRGVVFFRNQDLSDVEQVDFARRMGDVEEHGMEEGPLPGLIPIHADAESKAISGERWHSDMCQETIPPAYSILMMNVIPPAGGDTLYANMYAAYDKLSPRMKQLLDGLTATNRRSTLGLPPDVAAKEIVSDHPIVRTHPITKYRALYANPAFTTHINELTISESKDILSFLEHHVDKGAEFQIRFSWEPNSVAIWDNRAVQHQAVWDYWPNVRTGRRIVVAGTKPYYDEASTTQSAALDNNMIAPKWNRKREDDQLFFDSS